MKKNRMMRLASVLLVCVLLTTSVISGTFAKYTSTASGTDTARVAKWSFKVGDTSNSTEIATETAVTNLTFNLFSTVVDDDDVTDTDDDAHVDNGTSETIIAPGTGGMFDIVLTNESEVTAKYGIVFTEEDNAGGIPIQYSLDGNTWGNIDSIKIVAADTGDTVIPFGSTGNTKTVHVYWKWDYYDSDARDQADTLLGIAAQTSGSEPSITVKAEITVTQVD